MIRRVKVVLTTAAALLAGGAFILFTIGATLLYSDRGRTWVERRVEREVRAAIGAQANASVAGLRLDPLGTLRLDSLVLRDSGGAPVVATGAITLEYALLPLLDRELHLRLVSVAGLHIAAEQDASGAWNLGALTSGGGAPRGVAPAGRAWRVRLDSLALVDGAAGVTRTAADGSRSQVNLRDLELHLGPTELRTPVSGAPAVATVALRHLTGGVDEPAVRLTEARGTIALAGDTLRLDLDRWVVDGSSGTLRGVVELPASEGDPRLSLTLQAERVDLASLSWASELLPPSGTARATIRVGNGASPGTIRYSVTDLVVESIDSRLSGRLVAEVNGDELAVRDVDVAAAPLDLRLVRALLGDSTPPPPLDGALHGRLWARGGPLSSWAIDSARFAFEDRRVGGARSELQLAGVIDLESTAMLLDPLHIRFDSVDVQLLGAVVGVADSLRGYLRGQVQLDGPIDDLRFRDLALDHHDGALPVSRVTGSGRIAGDTTRVWLEAELELERLSVAAFGRAVTDERLAGVVAGSLRTSAVGDSMALVVALIGEGAELNFDGATSLDSTRLVARGALRVRGFDARRFAPNASIPAHHLSARAELGIDSRWEAPAGPVRISLDAGSEIGGVTFSSGDAELVLEPGGVRVDSLALLGPMVRLGARGRLSRDPALRDTLQFALAVDSVAGLRGFLSDSLAAAWIDSLGGTMTLEGIALGSFDTLDVRAALTVDSLRAGSYGASSITADLLLDGLPHATRGLVTVQSSDLLLGGIRLASVEGEATVREAAWADASLRLVAGDTLRASLRSDVHWMGDSLAIRLDSLDATTREARWSLLRPAALFSGPDRFTIDDLDLRSSEGARLSVTAQFDATGAVNLRAEAVRVPIAHARFTGLVPTRIAGLASVDATLIGTRASPQWTFTAELDSVQVDGLEAPTLRAEGRYLDRRTTMTVHAPFRGRDALLLTAELPIDLALEPRRFSDRLLDDDLFVRLVADGAPLSGLSGLLPAVRDLEGGFDADVQVSGSWRELEPRGLFIVRDAAFAIPSLGTGYQDGLLDLSFSPDSIIVHRARISDERAASDTVTIEGAVANTGGRWRADVQTVARRLRVIDDPRVAEADVSWALRLHGPLDSLALSGDVTVPNADIHIGRQQRRVLALEEETTATDEAMRYAPRIDGLRVRLGNEVRLRSPEANVQLTGTVNVVGTLDEPDVRGEIFATRGTYRLDLGLLQRSFQVDSGRVRVNGPLSVPATLDIHTTYTVRQAERDDVLIRARLTGTVDEPRLTLSSGDLGTTASETEIISYLLFGAPTFVLDGESASAVRLATAALVPSIGGAAERALGARIPFLSELQVTTVAGDSPRDFTLNSFEGLLNSFALTAGTQIGPDSYLRMSGGVCRGANRAGESLPAWMGITAEYRPRERLSAELSLSPGSAPCNRVGAWTQIYQFGLDLFKDFRW